MKKETIFSFIFAASILGGAIWIADRPLLQQEGKLKNSQNSTITPQQISPGHEDPSATSSIGNQDSSTMLNPDTQKGISKCMVGDKIIYADNGCPAGAKTVNLTLHDPAGVLSPPKESLDELTAKRQAKERMEAVATQQQLPAPKRSKKMECDSLAKYILDLDEMGHKPQSSYTMDWIRQQRLDTRNSQYRLGC